MRWYTQLGSLLFAVLLGCTPTPPAQSRIAIAPEEVLKTSPSVEAFIDKMVVKHGFNKQQLTALFGKIHLQPKVISLMTTPHEAKPWYIYRTHFLNPARVVAGAKFWREHASQLAKVQQKYGVPPQIVVAILGVETNYGQIQGQFKTLDSLATLAFHYPPRAAFFQSELEHFLLLTRDLNWEPHSVIGSYAGALGWAQFMPSSYRHYAVAEGHAGYSDLFHNKDDAMSSIANYFKANGWQAGQTLVVPAKVSGSRYEQLKANQLKPSLTIGQLIAAGVKPQFPVATQQKATFLKLPLANGNEYWLGLHNFYVLSRYNPNINYTMAVYQLSQQILTTYQQQDKH